MPKDPPKKRITRIKATITKKDNPIFSSAKKRAKTKPKKLQLKLRPPKQRVIEKKNKEEEEKKKKKTQSLSQQSRIGPHISLAMTSVLYAKKVEGAR